MDWLPYIIIFLLVGLYARLWFVVRDMKCIHDLVHDLHDHVFMETDDIINFASFTKGIEILAKYEISI